MKLGYLSVKNYEYEGCIYDYEDQGEVAIDGEFTVDWDDDIPMPRVLNLYVDNKRVDLDKFAELVTQIEDEIAADPRSDWEADRLAYLADRAYDSYYDR